MPPDRAAQSSARNALTTAKTIFTDSEDYRQATPERMKQMEPSLDFVEDGQSTGSKLVSIKAPNQTEFRLAVLSASGTCFALRDRVGGPGSDYGTRYAKATTQDCRATSIPDEQFTTTTW